MQRQKAVHKRTATQDHEEKTLEKAQNAATNVETIDEEPIKATETPKTSDDNPFAVADETPSQS